MYSVKNSQHEWYYDHCKSVLNKKIEKIKNRKAQSYITDNEACKRLNEFRIKAHQFTIDSIIFIMNRT